MSIVIIDKLKLITQTTLKTSKVATATLIAYYRHNNILLSYCYKFPRFSAFETHIFICHPYTQIDPYLWILYVPWMTWNTGIPGPFLFDAERFNLTTPKSLNGPRLRPAVTTGHLLHLKKLYPWTLPLNSKIRTCLVDRFRFRSIGILCNQYINKIFLLLENAVHSIFDLY